MRTYTWTIRWGNPHTSPPEGKPEVLLSVTRQAASGIDTPQEILDAYTIGTGYAIHCKCDDALQPKRRRMSEESKQKLRRTRLRRRLAGRAPLFADELYAETVNAKPEYYGRDPKDV